MQLYAPFVTKFHRIDFTNTILREGIDYPLLRYSDILLTYAGATNELGTPTPKPTKL